MGNLVLRRKLSQAPLNFMSFPIEESNMVDNLEEDDLDEVSRQGIYGITLGINRYQPSHLEFAISRTSSPTKITLSIASSTLLSSLPKESSLLPFEFHSPRTTRDAR